MDKNNYWYEYSIDKANYLMVHNAICKGTGISSKTNEIFWCFDKDEINQITGANKPLNKNNNLNLKEDKLIYISNLPQSCVYIKEGIKPVDMLFDNKQNKLVFVFRAIDTKKIWAKWKNHEYENESAVCDIK